MYFSHSLIAVFIMYSSFVALRKKGYKIKKTTSFGWFSANLDCSKAHKIIIRFQRSFVVRFSINGMNGSILYDFLSN